MRYAQITMIATAMLLSGCGGDKSSGSQTNGGDKKSGSALLKPYVDLKPYMDFQSKRGPAYQAIKDSAKKQAAYWKAIGDVQLLKRVKVPFEQLEGRKDLFTVETVQVIPSSVDIDSLLPEIKMVVMVKVHKDISQTKRDDKTFEFTLRVLDAENSPVHTVRVRRAELRDLKAGDTCRLESGLVGLAAIRNIAKVEIP